ncbi:MAG TPA: S8 family serine peptidase [Gemmatimonadaceae bacterium]|nr:S8 family serine peptidase [Gemmatimonadaceae bacterium]
MLGAAAVLVAIAACEQPTSAPVAADRPPSKSESDQQPFYYYAGEKIPLVRDPTRLVIAGSALAGQAAQTALSTARIGATQEVLSSAREHVMLRLPAGLTDATLGDVRRIALRRNGEVKFVSFVYKVASTGSDFIPLNRLVVEFKTGVSKFQIDSINTALGTSIERAAMPDSAYPEYWLTYPSDSASDPLVVAAKLSRSALVKWATPDHVADFHPHYVPPDPFYPVQYYLKNIKPLLGVAVDDNLEPAWDLTKGSPSIKVAVLDGGVQASHPQLSAATSGGIGYDAFWDAPGVPGSGEWAFSPCMTCVDSETHITGDAHGTAVAGIIAAAHDGAGIAGIAPGVHLESARIFRGGNQTSSSRLADAVRWAGAHADVLNMSFGGGTPDNGITGAIQDVSRTGRSGKGAVVVISAGNSGASLLEYPAALSLGFQSSIISVGAIGRRGEHSWYSNRGSGLTLVAPSSDSIADLYTTDLLGSPGYNGGPFSSPNDYTAKFGGTSASAPQVAGVAALVLSREPNLTSMQVKARLEYGAIPWGTSTMYGSGKLDAYNALTGINAVIGGPLSVAGGCTGPSFPFCTARTFSWTATASAGSGSYTYQWASRACYVSNSTQLGTAATQTVAVGPTTPSFFLQVTVTSGARMTKTLILVSNTSWTPGPGQQCSEGLTSI